MKVLKYLIIGVITFCLLGAMRIQALKIFSYDKTSNQYLPTVNSRTNNLSLPFIQESILSQNFCLTPDTVVIPSGVAKKNECETFGGKWYPYGGNINYGDCKIVDKTVCESKGGTFYPSLVINNGVNGVVNITTDMEIKYILIAYNDAININAKVSFADNGTIAGTIGENGKIVINDNGKIEYPDLSKKLFGNTNDYDISVGPGGSITYKTLTSNAEAFPASSNENDDVLAFLSNLSTTSDYFELNGNFKLNKPFNFGDKLILKDNTTLELLSNLTIDNGAKLTTELNSKLLNSATLTVNGNLDIKGTFNNGYVLDNSSNPITTNTGTVVVGSTGKITLLGNATGTNNSVNDIPVTLHSGNAGDLPIESIIPGNGPKTITINSLTNGTITSSKTRALKGEEITLAIKPSVGYKLKSITAKDKFGEMPVEIINNKFIMPSYNLFIEAKFEKIEYEVTNGDNQKHTIGTNEDAVFRINAEKSLFDKLYLNDEELNSDFYTITEGSTIITLKQDFLNNLLPSTYNLKATFNDGGVANTTFVIAQPAENNPKTGDSIIISIIIASVSLIGLLGVGFFLKKKNA